MGMNFPNSPTVGQQVTFAGATWQWDGVVWNLVPQMAPATCSDIPPANPAIGQMWWNSSNGQLYIWYDDGNSKQWVQAAGVPGAVSAWEKIETRDVATAATEQQFKDLSAFRDIRITATLQNAAACIYTMQLSEDNAATWVATGYAIQNDYGSASTAAAAAQASQTAIPLCNSNPVLNSTAGGTAGFNLRSFELRNFNKALWTSFIGNVYYQVDPTGAHVVNDMGGVQPRMFADSAFKVIGSTAFTGRIIVEGVRG